METALVDEGTNECFRLVPPLNSCGRFERSLRAEVRKSWLDTTMSSFSSMIDIDSRQKIECSLRRRGRTSQLEIGNALVTGNSSESPLSLPGEASFRSVIAGIIQWHHRHV
jgi:hypothetical protein